MKQGIIGYEQHSTMFNALINHKYNLFEYAAYALVGFFVAGLSSVITDTYLESTYRQLY